MIKSSIADKESIAILFLFNYRSNPGLWAYDFTEFIGYSLVITFLIYSYIKKHILLADKLDKVKAWFILLILAYCNFVLFFIIVSDNYSIAYLLFAIIGGIMLFQISMYITEIFISIFTNHNKKNNKFFLFTNHHEKYGCNSLILKVLAWLIYCNWQSFKKKCFL